MPSSFLAGLTGGASKNNVNVIVMDTGLRHARYTTVKAGSFAARALLSRLDIGGDYVKQNAFTIKTT